VTSVGPQALRDERMVGPTQMGDGTWPPCRPEDDDVVVLDLFAGLPVTDYQRAVAWYEKLLGAEPSFLPNDVEAVWEIAENRYLFIEVRPDHAGHAMHTIFASDFDTRVQEITDRGVEPADRETYSNGVRKWTYRDPDGNEIGFGGAPV